jgi:hypothetical protein
MSSESTGTVDPLQFAATLKKFGPDAEIVVAVETVPDVLDFETVMVNGFPFVFPTRTTVEPLAAGAVSPETNSRNSATFGPRSVTLYAAPRAVDVLPRAAASSVAICVVVTVVPTVSTIARPLQVTVSVSAATHVPPIVIVSRCATGSAAPVHRRVAIYAHPLGYLKRREGLSNS